MPIRRRILPAGALLAALAACAPGPMQEAPQARSMPGADLSVEGCSEALIALFRDRAALQAYLPAGYVARDGAALLELGAETENTGLGAASVNVIQCEDTALGTPDLITSELGILIEAPQLSPDPGLAPSLFDFYLDRVYASPESPFLELLREAGFAVEAATGGVSAGGLIPGIPGASAELADAAGEIARFSVDSPGDSVTTGIVRLWYQTPAGPAAQELRFTDLPMLQGTIRSCAIRPDSRVAEILGASDCPPGLGLSLYFPEQTWVGELRIFAGASVGS